MKKKKNNHSGSVLNFELGNLFYFDSRALFNKPEREKVDAIILSFALAYNDIKDTLFYWEVLQEHMPSNGHPKGRVSAKEGQFSGMSWHIYRRSVSILSEILQLIEAHWSTLKDKDIKKTIDKLPEGARAHWQELISYCKYSSSNTPKINKLKTLISRIRDHVSYHYWDPKELSMAYKRAFFESDLRSDERAYFSGGKNVEQSRFLFADAAVEDYLKTKLNNYSTTHDEDINKLLRSAHVAIWYLVRGYLNHIQAGVHNLGDADQSYEVGKSKRSSGEE